MSYFFAYFLLKLDESFRNQEIFMISLFSNSSELGFQSDFFYRFWLIFSPIWSWSVDSHIFADPVPGSQNFADPMDLDPKHCWGQLMSHTKCGPDRFSRFDVYWIQTDTQKKAKYTSIVRAKIPLWLRYSIL